MKAPAIAAEADRREAAQKGAGVAWLEALVAQRLDELKAASHAQAVLDRTAGEGLFGGVRRWLADRAHGALAQAWAELAEVRQGLLRRRAAGTDLDLAWWERLLAGRPAASRLCFQTVALELLRARPARSVPNAEDLARAYDPAAGALLTFGDLAVNLARQDGRVLGPADLEAIVARARELGAAQTLVGHGPGRTPDEAGRTCGEALRLRLEAELASPS